MNVRMTEREKQRMLKKVRKRELDKTNKR